MTDDLNPTPLRLLVVTPRYFPDTGGVERHVYETAWRLAERGVDVTVLTTDRTRTRPARERFDDVEILRVPAWPSGRDYYIAPGIYRIVRDGDWDLVHLQSWHTPVAPLTMLACLRSKIPYVVTPHGRGYSAPLRRLIRPAQRRFLRPFLHRSNQVIAVARFERDLLVQELRLDPDLVKVIPNGSDLSDAVERPSRAVEPIIASIGRLERFKGHHRILEALPYVLEERPDARLVIAGDGPYEKTLRQLATKLGVAERVTIEFFPMSDREHLGALISRAALIVLLSEYETQPISALEAAALGKPVLVANVAGMKELADDGLATALPLDTPAPALGRLVVDQLSDPHQPPAFRVPSWDDCVDALLGVYSQHTHPSAR